MRRTRIVATIGPSCDDEATLLSLLQAGVNVCRLNYSHGAPDDKTPLSAVKHLDIYFDGCDQFDKQLNALKSGGGIHTTEKILASMAAEFILMGDDTKFVPQLTTTYPLVIEILPKALQIVLTKLRSAAYPDAEIKLRMGDQKDGAVISDNGNLLADIRFGHTPHWQQLNIDIKMIPGIVEHSLFYGMATKAIIAGENGIRIITPEL